MRIIKSNPKRTVRKSVNFLLLQLVVHMLTAGHTELIHFK